MTLERVLTEAKTAELSEGQVRRMKAQDGDQVLSLRYTRNRGKNFSYASKNKNNSSYRNRESDRNSKQTRLSFAEENQKGFKCFRCNKEGQMARSSVCAAKGKKCKTCGKIGHFSVVCWNNKTSQKEKVVGFNKRSEINVIKQETFRSSSEEDVFHVEERTKSLREIELWVENVPIHFIIDSGAGVNVIDSRSCKFFLEKTKKKISQTDMKLYAYGSEVPLDLKGEIEYNVAYRRNTVLTKIYIVKGECSGCLLGKKTAEELGVLRMDMNELTKEISIQRNKWDKQSIVKSFPNVFEGVGKLKNVQVSIHIDEKN